jgi:AP-3 complex subunit delta-1
MFERSLSSLIKGLRSHRGRDEPKYVATLMEEIKHEVRSGDMDVKAEAVLKLTYVSYIALVAYSKYH